MDVTLHPPVLIDAVRLATASAPRVAASLVIAVTVGGLGSAVTATPLLRRPPPMQLVHVAVNEYCTTGSSPARVRGEASVAAVAVLHVQPAAPHWAKVHDIGVPVTVYDVIAQPPVRAYIDGLEGHTAMRQCSLYLRDHLQTLH
jgi:hypothetical protein